MFLQERGTVLRTTRFRETVDFEQHGCSEHAREERWSCFETFLNADAARVKVCLCSLSRSDRIATQVSCCGSEGFDVCPGDSLSPSALPQTALLVVATGQLVPPVLGVLSS